MPQILFRGKKYNSEFEMPQEVRQAYQESERKRTTTKSLTDVVDMPGEVKGIYERALARIQDQSFFSQSPTKLPTTEELYQQSAPQGMQRLASDESIYQPSRQVIDPENSTIEPESGFVMNSMVINFVWLLLLVGFIFVVTQFFW